MAVESPRVKADVIEASEFPRLSQQYAVSGVPKIVVNDRHEFLGARGEAAFLAEIQRALQPPV
jgi:predicted DsbA family dithiol-disulfide isomerase